MFGLKKILKSSGLLHKATTNPQRRANYVDAVRTMRGGGGRPIGGGLLGRVAGVSRPRGGGGSLLGRVARAKSGRRRVAGGGLLGRVAGAARTQRAAAGQRRTAKRAAQRRGSVYKRK